LAISVYCFLWTELNSPSNTVALEPALIADSDSVYISPAKLARMVSILAQFIRICGSESFSRGKFSVKTEVKIS
jgi:hypothetical protein